MAKQTMLTLNFRHQVMEQDRNHRNVWRVIETRKRIPASKVLLLICDMWDTHTQTGAAQRVDELAPRMNKVVAAARAKGVHIIHGPNDCMDFYAGTPARQRMIDAPHVQPPAPIEHDDPPKPFDDSRNHSDTNTIDKTYTGHPWTRQHKAIEIDQRRDGITVSGSEVYNYMQLHGIEQYLIMGVHTGMCILHRTFGIKQMVRWGVPTALVRDMTDAIYNPQMPPYVSHEEGTALVVGFIEKFWCPTIASGDLM
ncbi:MAG: isochorismatase family protein [Phycisphaerae bacterium]